MYYKSVLKDTIRQRKEAKGMNRDLFEYEMKIAGYRTPEQRANAIGLSLSAYYRRLNNECECSQGEISKVRELLGSEKADQIFFGNKVS